MMKAVDRPIAEKTRGAIEKRLESMGDFVKMSYLQRALNSGLDFETRKFVLLRLGGIYEARRMNLEAARLIKSAAEINTTFKDKIRDFMRAVDLYIKGGDYNEAERIFNQSLALGSDRDKDEMKQKLKDFYLTQAKIFLNLDKRTSAKTIYERLLGLDLGVEERTRVQRELLALYDKLGCVREYFNLKKSM